MTSAIAPQVKVLEAVQQIKRLRGGSQSHLMRASDGNFWVVKFQNNAQHFRVLANEFFASRIGSYLGLPMPEVAVIEVCEWLIEHTPDLHMDNAGLKAPCSSGLQFASRFVDDPENTIVCDYLPENFLLRQFAQPPSRLRMGQGKRLDRCRPHRLHRRQSEEPGRPAH